MLAEAESDADLFVAQIGMVWRKFLGKIALIVAGPAAYCPFEQPLPYLIFCTAAYLADFIE